MYRRTKWQAIGQKWRAIWSGYRQGKISNKAYPSELFIYVTDRCNGRCEHCFYHAEVNRGTDLPLDGMAKMFGAMPPLEQCLLTGGEPFLRNDLPAIVRTVVEQNKPAQMQINTNGMNPARVERSVGEILAAAHSPLMLQVSIDGLRSTHDAIRGIPGSFDQAVETIERCRNLSRGHPEFQVAVLSVICDRNYHEIDALSRFLYDECQVMHGFELIRGSSFSLWELAPDVVQPGDPKGLELPPRDAWPQLLSRLREINRREGYPHEIFALRHKYQFEMFDGKKPPIPCTSAGNWSGFIYPDGSVALCEFSRPVGNLADHDWDFHALWHGEEANKRRRQVRRCYCTHSCNLSRNLEISLKAHLRLIYWL